MKKSRIHSYLTLGFLAVFCFESCTKLDSDAWNNQLEHTYAVDSSYFEYQQLTVKPNTTPDDAVLFFDVHNLAFDKYALPEAVGTEVTLFTELTFQCLIPDYEVVSGFAFISGNFDQFSEPNPLRIDYTFNFKKSNYGFEPDYQFNHHADLRIYQIPYTGNLASDVSEMSNWIPLNSVHSDTLDDGTGTLTAEVQDLNSFYVVARKYP